MFEAIVKRVEASIRSSVDHAWGTFFALLPLIVAFGFATAAADSYLSELYGTRVAYVVLCVAYLVITFAVYVVARVRAQSRSESAQAELAEAPIVNPVKAAFDQLQLPNVEQRLLTFAGETGAPAAKALAEQVAKNAHLLFGAAAGIYVASRLVDALTHGKTSRRV
jgi:hypothetical protein